jgi:hypothetical protein
MRIVSTRFYPVCYPLGFQALMVQVLITVYESNTHTREVPCHTFILRTKKDNREKP